MKVTDNDKHSSLLQYGVNYDRKQFYDIGRGASIAQFDRISYESSFLFRILYYKTFTAVIYNAV
jgi:hypothetical protein